MARIPDGAVDLIITDPPYGLGKDYGNDSDKLDADAYLRWMEQWIDLALPKLKSTGSLYICLTWRYSPEIFVMLKQRMTMLNEIIWDRRVPSMGGSVRNYTSVHDTIGFFAKQKGYYFDLDAIRIPYDAETKKARSRSIFVGAKWLELGYNPKDLWSVSRLHREHPERSRPPDAKAARNHRAHGESVMPARRRDTRSFHGERHHGSCRQTLWTQLCRIRIECRILRRN